MGFSNGSLFKLYIKSSFYFPLLKSHNSEEQELYFKEQY